MDDREKSKTSQEGKLEKISPGFNVFRGILVSISDVNTFTNNDGQLETVTVFTAKDNYLETGNGELCESWFPGQIPQDLIGRPFHYWVSGLDSEMPGRAYCMKFTLNDGSTRMYRRHTHQKNNGFLDFDKRLTTAH